MCFGDRDERVKGQGEGDNERVWKSPVMHCTSSLGSRIALGKGFPVHIRSFLVNLARPSG